MGRFRISLRAALGVTAVIGIFFGWTSWQRQRNSIHLKQHLDRLDDDCAEIKYDFEMIHTVRQFRDEWLGDTGPRPTNLRLFRVPTSTAKLLNNSNATDQIKTLELVQYADSNPFFDGNSNHGFHEEPTMEHRKLKPNEAFCSNDCPMFFEDWERLEQIILRDVVIPAQWHDRFNRLGSVKKVIISGGLCNLEPESLVGMPKLEQVILANRGISSSRLAKLKEAMPGIEITLLGSFDSDFSFQGTEGLSQHDPQDYERMKSLVSGIKELIPGYALKKLDAPPASPEEIAAMEQKLGVPLPRSLRAFYEVTNGWKGVFFDHKIRSIKETLDDYWNRRSIVYFPDEYDFTPYWDQWANPNVIPVNQLWGIEFRRDLICDIDEGGESGPIPRPVESDLFQKLEGILDDLRNEEPYLQKSKSANER